MPSEEDYARAWAREREHDYADVTRFEQECCFAVDKGKLDQAARVLACPVKANPPCWQHGRVIYSAARRYAAKHGGPQLWLDIGTAKGFSACCMSWASTAARLAAPHLHHWIGIVSLDVIDPEARVARNSVADLQSDHYQTVRELVHGFVSEDRSRLNFVKADSVEWLERLTQRCHFAFVDGRHKFEVVKREIELLSKRQESGDVLIFDDMQVEGVGRAVRQMQGYKWQTVKAHAARWYAVAEKI
jgi:predicted O-methyltransferase YrrM